MDENIEDLLKQSNEVISEVKKFSIESLGLPIGKSFETFKEDNQGYFWVYAAKKYELGSQINEFDDDRPYAFFENNNEAVKHSEKLRSKGYDTFIFEGEAHGGGDTKITLPFLKASAHRKAEVLIHESVHAYLAENFDNDNFPEIPYDLNESLATHVGKQGAMKFCEIHYPEQYDLGKRSLKLFSEFAKLVNSYHNMLQIYYMHGLIEKKEEFLDFFKEELESLSPGWFKDTKFNNAFLIRHIDYTKLYPIVSGYFNDNRRSIRGFFGASKNEQIAKLNHLLRLKDERKVILAETLK